MSDCLMPICNICGWPTWSAYKIFNVWWCKSCMKINKDNIILKLMKKGIIKNEGQNS